MIYTVELDFGANTQLLGAADKVDTCATMVNNILPLQTTCKNIVFTMWDEGKHVATAYVSGERNKLGKVTCSEIEEQFRDEISIFC